MTAPLSDETPRYMGEEELRHRQTVTSHALYGRDAKALLAAAQYFIAEAERLREALEPFAEMFRANDATDDMTIILQRGAASDMTVLTNHDLAAAAALLPTRKD